MRNGVANASSIGGSVYEIADRAMVRRPNTSVDPAWTRRKRLREAGESLGLIQSTIVPQRTTFEELNERAKDLQRRAAALERKAS